MACLSAGRALRSRGLSQWRPLPGPAVLLSRSLRRSVRRPRYWLPGHDASPVPSALWTGRVLATGQRPRSYLVIGTRQPSTVSCLPTLARGDRAVQDDRRRNRGAGHDGSRSGYSTCGSRDDRGDPFLSARTRERVWAESISPPPPERRAGSGRSLSAAAGGARTYPLSTCTCTGTPSCVLCTPYPIATDVLRCTGVHPLYVTSPHLCFNHVGTGVPLYRVPEPG